MSHLFNLQQVFILLPLLFLFITSLVPISAKVAGTKLSHNFITIEVMLGILLAIVSIFTFPSSQSLIFFNALKLDAIVEHVAALILISLFFSVLFLKNNTTFTSRQFEEKLFLLLNAAIGLILMLWANDLLIMFIGLEYASLSLYILILLSRSSFFSREAAIKYFLLGSFFSVILLYGLSFIYGSVGSLYFSELLNISYNIFSMSRLFSLGVLLVLSGLFFKVAIVPFHSWLPDVYEGAESAVVSFMASAIKLVVFIVLLKFAYLDIALGLKGATLLNILQWLSALSILVGSVAALKQVKLKRIIAYSSIAHSGYLLIAITVAMKEESSYALVSSLYYLLSYTILTVAAFGIISYLEQYKQEKALANTDSTEKEDKDISLLVSDLKSLLYTAPVLAISLIVVLLGLAGIPPTFGFFAKFLVLLSALKEGLFWLSIWAIIGSIISLYYYFKPIITMCLSKDDLEPSVFSFPKRSLKNSLWSQGHLFSIVILAFLSLVLGFFSQTIISFLFQILKTFIEYKV
ncbi:MAG: NADH-quinone oxidoreductase subunit N [Bdellovibrionaceae bacterium]|nr:NADH-quinone oxidoreductase subunit N [Pseudobdellovibrionaceae bacterium]